jgi:hypothetical protein
MNKLLTKLSNFTELAQASMLNALELLLITHQLFINL